MSFLNLRKKVEKKKEEPKHLTVTSVARPSTPALVGASAKEFTEILRRPRITEKALTAQARGVFVFEVASRATKRNVAQAVAALYKVTPRKVAMVLMQKKNVTTKEKPGFSGGGKKAYVYLKKGDRIEMV